MAYSLSISITQNSQSVANNTSNVTVKVNCSWTYGTWSGENLTKYCTIDGVKHSFDSTDINPNQTTSGSSTLFTWTGNINHKSDGTKKLEVFASTKTTNSSGTQTASASKTLTTIPRASTISATSAVVGSNSTITINRKSSAFTHTLKYSFGSLSGTIATKTSSTSVAFSLPTSFYAQIGASATSKSGTITCDTYNGSTLIGSSSTTFTAKTSSATCAPTLSPTIITAESTRELTGNNDTLIKYYSTATIAFNATARNSATLKSKKVTSGGYTLTADGKIDEVTSGTFNFTATDSRGYTTTKTITKTLIPYVKLTCSYTAKVTVDGTATLSTSGNYFNGSFGAVSNTLTVQYRYRESGGSFGSWVNITPSISSNKYTATAKINGLDYQKAYDVQVRAIDKLATITPSAKSIKAQPVFDWGADSFNHNTHTTLANGKALQSYDTSGNLVNMAYLGTTNILNIGGGAYAPNTIHITSDGLINMTSATAGISNRAYGVNKILWSGTRYMTNEHTITLSEAISAQPNGIALVWSSYADGAAEDIYFNITYIPKFYAENLEGKGLALLLTSTPITTHLLTSKYLYINNTSITGYSGNNKAALTASGSGTVLTPNAFVLRYVIGV